MPFFSPLYLTKSTHLHLYTLLYRSLLAPTRREFPRSRDYILVNPAPASASSEIIHAIQSSTTHHQT